MGAKKEVIEKEDVGMMPAEILESVPKVEGPNVADELKEYRNRTEDEKLRTKADKVHEIFMDIKPGPITLKPSKGWVSYICGKIRFAALEVNKNIIKVHSLELNDGKMKCQIISLTSKAKDKVPITKLRNRAELYITQRTEK